MLLTHLFENKHMTEADIASVNWNTDSESGVTEGGEKDRQWSNKDMEKLRVATRNFDDILSADGPDAFKQELTKKRIQTKPMAGPKGVLPEQGVTEVSNDTLTSYLTKVDADSRKHKMDPTKRDPKKASKSVMGFSRAFNKLDARPRKEQDVAEDSENAFAPLKLNDQKSNAYGDAILDIADRFEDKFSDENASEYATAIATVGHAFLNNGMRSGRAKLFGLEQAVYKHVLMSLDQQGFGIVKDLIQPHFKPDDKVPFNNMNEAPGAETLDHNQSTVSSNMKAFDLGEGDISQLEKDVADAPVEPIANMEATEKVGNMDADAFDAAMARLKKLAGAGPLKTVWDPKKRVYRNMPTAVQPKK